MSGSLSRAEQRMEAYSAVLLSLATIATAWCAFQASQWDGEQAFLLNEASAEGRQSSLWTALASQRGMLDGIIFMNYVEAIAAKDDSLAAFYEDRFRPTLKVAVDAWLATSPLTNPHAPPHPFAMSEYLLVEDSIAGVHATESTLRVAEAREVDRHSDAYVLLTVFFASVLFFGGIATKFSSVGARKGILAVGTLVFLVALGALLTFPVSL